MEASQMHPLSSPPMYGANSPQASVQALQETLQDAIQSIAQADQYIQALQGHLAALQQQAGKIG
jgi:hypothetical protein